MSAPFEKWIYDTAIHLEGVVKQGWGVDAEYLFGLMPEGLRLVARGINDYNSLITANQAVTQVMPLAQSPQATVPAPVDLPEAADGTAS